MQGNQINLIINQMMNNGLRTIIKNVLNSTNPGELAIRIMDAKFGNDPRWIQAKQMANSGNAKEKATNMFKEHGVDVENIIDGIAKEIK